MQTYRQVLSDILSSLKVNNADDKISLSNSFVVHKFMDKADIFLKQEVDQKRILKINGLWKPLKSIDLIDVSVLPIDVDMSECLIKRSREVIPETYSSSYGSLIKILNVLGFMEYKQIKPFDYKEIRNREHRNKRVKYFWVDEGYIYIPDSEVDKVKGFGLFKNSFEADRFNGTIGCCYKPLDSEILLPDYIISLAKTEALKELLSAPRQLQEDEHPNNNDIEKLNRP